MEDAQLILSHIKSLEAQLRVLQARIQSPEMKADESSRSFAELYGQLKGKVESAEDEIENVLYRLPEDND